MKLLTIIAMALISINGFGATYKIQTKPSTIKWVGKKVTGQHDGTVQLSSGSIELDGDKLVGGEFVVNMRTINTTDLEGKWKAKLDGHLKNEDFFNVKKHKTAKFKITSARKISKTTYEVSGDLTIKGITKSETLKVMIQKAKNSVKAKGKLVFDRTKYDVKYNSGSFFENLGDKMIYNDVELDFKIVAK